MLQQLIATTHCIEFAAIIFSQSLYRPNAWPDRFLISPVLAEVLTPNDLRIVVCWRE
jgi:hypothetical protein